MKIIFVDDEQMILNGIKRVFFRSKWDVKYANSGAEALDILKTFSADFIVSDMCMPGMNGADLLENVCKLYPSTVRIVLSGDANPELSVRASYVAHQWYNKPYSPDVLKEELENIYSIRNGLPYKEIKRIVGQVTSLPSIPEVYIKIKSVLDDDTITMKDISLIISENVSLTAKILQVANSSFFITGSKVTSIENAITRLGINVICNIVAVTEIYANFQESPSEYYNEILQRGLKTAKLAASIVDKSISEITMLSGLLHNIGELIFCQINPSNMDIYIKERIIGADNSELESRLFKINSIQIASYLLHLWHFPYDIIEHITLQNTPEKLIKNNFGSAAAVYVSKMIINQLIVDEFFIKHFNISEQLNQWSDDMKDDYEIT